MSDSKQDRIAQLLKHGLDAYGADRIPEAIEAWEKVLVLDPACQEAHDYLKTADRRSSVRPQRKGETSRAVKSIVEQARNMLEKGELEEALELLGSAATAEPWSLEVQATVELVRSRMLRQYRGDLGGVDSVPVRRLDDRRVGNDRAGASIAVLRHRSS